jgi:hypothetical protein
MIRQQFGLRLDQLGKPCLQHLSNAPVVLLPRALEQRLIGRLLDEGMLEQIGSLRQRAALVEHLGLHQLPETPP